MASITDRLPHRTIYSGEEEEFRRLVRAFLDREVDAKYQKYESGELPFLDLWQRAVDAGIVGVTVPVEYGGMGAGPSFGVIVSHELGRSIGYATVGTCIATDNATNLLFAGANEATKAALAPRILAGEIQSMAMTEPDAGTNIAGMRTTARRDGDEYVINGNKTFVSLADKADIIYVVAKTDPDAGRRGLSIFAVEAKAPGVRQGRVNMLGLPLTGLGELYFDDVRVPAERILGVEGGALPLLSGLMSIDRIQTGARSLGQAELALQLTVDHTKQRLVADGRPLIEFQNTQMALGKMAIEIQAATALLKECVGKLREGTCRSADAAACKAFLTDVSARVVDGCVQLFGAAGIADEMPIARIYASNRQFRILAGTSELLQMSVAAKL